MWLRQPYVHETDRDRCMLRDVNMYNVTLRWQIAILIVNDLLFSLPEHENRSFLRENGVLLSIALVLSIVKLNIL